MQYSLGTALNYGLVREGAKEEQRGIDSIFINRVRAQANLNTLNTARKSGAKSSNFGIADNDTGLVTIPSNFGDIMKELEEVETRENIVNTLTKDQNVSKKGRAKLIADDSKFYSWGILPHVLGRGGGDADPRHRGQEAESQSGKQSAQDVTGRH